MQKILLFIVLSLIFNAVFAQKTVVFQEIYSDSTQRALSLVKNSPFWWSPKYFKPDKPLAKTTTGQYILDIDKPQRLSLRMGTNSQPVFASPGDTVSFIINPYLTVGHITYYSMHFSGKNAAQYNYDHLSDSLLPDKNLSFKKIQDIHNYKDSVTLWKNQRLQFLENYQQEFHLSDSFMEYAVASINSTYAWLLYNPLFYKYIRRDSLPTDYFTVVDQIQFNNDQLLDYHKGALVMRYINCYMEDTWSNFDIIYQNILHNFTGRTRAYLLSAMIGIFAEHQDQSYAAQLFSAIKSAPQYVKEPEYLDYIKESEEYYLKLNQAIPDSILLTTYLKPYGASSFISLKDVLEKYKGKALYIDFWASWCSPCRNDIAESHEAKEFLKERDVILLYMSQDTDENKWIDAVIEDQIREHQHLIKDPKESPLLKYFQVNEIPRYIIMDNMHKIKELHAPRPTGTSLPAFKTSIINATRKIVRYD
ncbi:MAG: TlpA family protein disulfide reductase [Bacteroidales bacterium]|nr:TlpA family protein disulfide reductase [Bacteroidales bacterium]